MTQYDPPGSVPPPMPAAPPAPGVLPYMTPVVPQVDTRMVKQFRQQIHAVGGLWILFGGLALGAGIFLMMGGDLGRAGGSGGGGGGGAGAAAGIETMLVAILLGLGALWLTVGIFS